MKRLLAKVCFDASFMCLSRFVAFRVTFNDEWSWTQCSRLLSRIPLKVTDQRWQTGPIQSALHFEVVFVVCWHQIGKIVQVVYIIVSLTLFKLHKNSSKIRIIKHWNKPFNWKAYLACICMIFWNNWLQTFVSMLHFCVCLDLFHFVSLLTGYAVERNVVAYCHAYN